MRIAVIFLFLTINLFGQKIKVINIQKDSIYISVENNTNKDMVIYPSSFILNSSLLNEKGKILYSELVHIENPKNRAYFKSIDYKEEVDAIKDQYSPKENDAVSFWYIDKNKVIIPKHTHKKINFLLYVCLLGGLLEKEYSSEKIYMTGKIKFLAENFFPEKYSNEIRSKKQIVIKDIKFCKIPIKDYNNLFCDKELD